MVCVDFVGIGLPFPFVKRSIFAQIGQKNPNINIGIEIMKFQGDKRIFGNLNNVSSKIAKRTSIYFAKIKEFYLKLNFKRLLKK